jgi:hypothetical protein
MFGRLELRTVGWLEHEANTVGMIKEIHRLETERDTLITRIAILEQA